jgi:tripartite-type tricarboxylate transporter receptor subunit TctC
MNKILFSRLLLITALVFSLPAIGQEYPNKPVTIIMPFPAGSVTDVLARLIAVNLQKKWGQPFIVKNQAGAAGNIGAEAVSKAPSDGYTLLLTPPPPLVINKSLYSKLSYEPESFEPISVIVTWPNVLLVHPKVGVNSIQELLALAKERPNRLNYASNGSGTTPHLTAEMLKSMTGVEIVHVPYKGAAPAISDLLAGQVDMAFVDLSSAFPLIRDNKLRALSVAGEKRISILPNTPSMSETLPGFLSIAWAGMVAPAGTPSSITNKLSLAITEILAQPDVARSLVVMNVESVGSTPTEMTTFMKKERERWGSLIRTTGARVD